jgi:uncharacterized protein (TIGR02145 family)
MERTLFIVLMLCACMSLNAQTVTDADGNVYKTVTIGKQVWMAENLKTTKLNDGSEIPLVTETGKWKNLSTPAYCWYENDRSKYGGVYGALYNWFVVNTGKLCPAGWHVPKAREWNVVSEFLGLGYAGGRLKEEGSVHWNVPNMGATNESGFTALPSGRRNAGGEFSGIQDWSYFWTSTPENEEKAWYRGIGNADAGIDRYSYNVKSGFSVRCLKD